jgi:hypothetical protein
MFQNRIKQYSHVWDDVAPAETASAANPTQGFVYAPIVQPASVPAEPTAWQQELYRRAFELAQAERASR